MSGAKQERRSVHRRSRYTLSPLASPAALLDVFKAADDAAVQRNPAGAVLQLVRCTQAVGESPLKLGVAGGAGAARSGVRGSFDHFAGARRGAGRARRPAPPPSI